MKRIAFLFLILACCLIQSVFAQQNGAATISSRGYTIGPGDEIKASVLGEKDFDFDVMVDENGNIEVPYAETPVSAMCKTERELRTDVAKVYSKYLKTPQIALSVSKRNSRPPVTVYGEVRTSQQVTLMRETRLLELLSFSGGVTEEAGGMIQVFHTQPPLCGEAKQITEWNTEKANNASVPSRLYSLSSVKQGSDEANPIIYPGDIVLVQKAIPVYVVGQVGSPQGVYIKEGGMTLVEALAKVGGVNAEARTKDITIRRLKPDSKEEREIISVNYDLIAKGQQKDVMLEPYDIIQVDKTKKSVAQTILDIAIGSGRTLVSGVSGSLPQRILY